MLSASPASYIEHAKEINGIARNLVMIDRPVEERKVEGLTLKIAIGLSLQAGELAGKSILCSFGMTPKEIKKKHARHRIDKLLGEAHMLVMEKWPDGAPGLDDFLSFQPVIEGGYGASFGMYLLDYFSKGSTSDPRSYFYPDEPTFIGPAPYYALVLMIDNLINVAERLEAILNPN